MTISKMEMEIALTNLNFKKEAMEKAFGVLFKAHDEIVKMAEKDESLKEVAKISEQANIDALTKLQGLYSF